MSRALHGRSHAPVVAKLLEQTRFVLGPVSVGSGSRRRQRQNPALQVRRVHLAEECGAGVTVEGRKQVTAWRGDHQVLAQALHDAWEAVSIQPERAGRVQRLQQPEF